VGPADGAGRHHPRLDPERGGRAVHRAGFLPTAMRDIAEASDVSVETVYAQGSGRALLLVAP